LLYSYIYSRLYNPIARVNFLSIRERVVLKVTRLGRYHRTTVPEEVRKLLSLKEGDEIAWAKPV
jgi:hypothetical protein